MTAKWSGRTSSVRRLTAILDSAPPSMPPSFRATPGDKQVFLTWGASTDDVAVRDYRVFKNGVRMAILPASARKYTMTGLTNGTRYQFGVRAVDTSGKRSKIAYAYATPVAAPAPAPTPTPTPSATPSPTPAPSTTVGQSLPPRMPQSKGTTFYVATSGSDSNPGTQTAPWRTIQKALNTLAAGQIAVVRGGTYAQNVSVGRGGTASAPITIKNYPGEKPVLRPAATSGDAMPLHLTSGAQYLRFQGLVFDGATGPSTTNIYADGSTHDVEFSDCENRNSQRQGFFSERTTARIQIIGCYFHDNGGFGPTQLDHHIYIEGSYNAVINNLLVRAPNGYGIQVYPSSDHIVVADNTINSVFRDGIIIGSDGGTTTTNALVTNNIIANARTAIVTYWGGTQGSGNVARNNMAYNAGSQPFYGSGITYSSNWNANPMFTNAAAGDFRPMSGSPALNKAEGPYTNPMDLDKKSRPQGTGPDLGAYER